MAELHHTHQWEHHVHHASLSVPATPAEHAVPHDPSSRYRTALLVAGFLVAAAAIVRFMR